MKGKRRCGWHWLAKQPLEQQLAAAQRRLARARATPGFVPRTRIPKALWPPGGRWCSGCQSFVPLFYVQGSRCAACERAARRAGHVERTYGLLGSEERALTLWQGGRCFVCGRRATTRQLAVDHDHVSGDPRGLLCSDERYGCNVLLRRLLGDVEACRRLLAYAEKWPLERMRSGEPPWSYVLAAAAADDGPPPF